MAVAFDAQGTAFTGASLGTGFTNTSLTIGGSGNVLIAFLQFSGTAPGSLVVNWDSTGTAQTMTLIGSKLESDNLAITYLFGLLAPHTGNKTFAVTNTSSSQSYTGNIVSFTGADQTSFATTFKNLVTDASSGVAGNYPTGGIAIATFSGDMTVFSAASFNQQFSASGGLGTSILALNTNVSGGGRYLAATTSSTTIACDVTAATANCCGVGCAIASSTIGFTAAGTIASSAGATTLTPALPSSTAGDALFAFTTKANSNAINTPAGWLKIYTQGGPATTCESTLFFAPYVTGMSAPVFSWSGSVACRAQVFGFTSTRGMGATIGATGARAAGSGNPHTSTAITSTQLTSLFATFDAQLSSTAQPSTPAGWNPVFANGDATSGFAFAIWSKASSSQGSSSGAISQNQTAVNWNENQNEIINDLLLGQACM